MTPVSRRKLSARRSGSESIVRRAEPQRCVLSVNGVVVSPVVELVEIIHLIVVLAADSENVAQIRRRRDVHLMMATGTIEKDRFLFFVFMEHTPGFLAHTDREREVIDIAHVNSFGAQRLANHRLVREHHVQICHLVVEDAFDGLFRNGTQGKLPFFAVVEPQKPAIDIIMRDFEVCANTILDFNAATTNGDLFTQEQRKFF